MDYYIIIVDDYFRTILTLMSSKSLYIYSKVFLEDKGAVLKSYENLFRIKKCSAVYFVCTFVCWVCLRFFCNGSVFKAKI